MRGMTFVELPAKAAGRSLLFKQPRKDVDGATKARFARIEPGLSTALQPTSAWSPRIAPSLRSPGSWLESHRAILHELPLDQDAGWSRLHRLPDEPGFRVCYHPHSCGTCTPSSKSAFSETPVNSRTHSYWKAYKSRTLAMWVIAYSKPGSSGSRCNLLQPAS